jgi:hypothetical protein
MPSIHAANISNKRIELLGAKSSGVEPKTAQ